MLVYLQLTVTQYCNAWLICQFTICGHTGKCYLYFRYNTVKMIQTFLPLAVNRSAVKIKLPCFLVNHTGSKYLPHGSSISCLWNKDDIQPNKNVDLTHLLLQIVTNVRGQQYVILVVGRLCFTNRKWNYHVVNIYFLYDWQGSMAVEFWLQTCSQLKVRMFDTFL